MRIDRSVERRPPIEIIVDGLPVRAYPGETLAAALIQHSPRITRDTQGRPRGLFCNMGTCSQCMVTLLPERRRVRACLVPVAEGMEVVRD